MELGVRLSAKGHTVFGLRRRPSGLPGGIRPVAADLSAPETLRSLPPVDALVFTAAPSGSGEDDYRRIYVEGLRNLLEASGLAAPEPEGRSGGPAAPKPEGRRRVIFTSSTAVYGQSDGSLVDETSETKPASYRGRVLLEAESLLAPLRSRATILRLAGIYGPGRSRLLGQVRRGEAEYVRGDVSNRIHRDDAAGALDHLLSRELEGVFLGVDCEPAEKGTILRWLAERTGSPPPRELAYGSGPRGNKRCSNRKLLASGYRFRYPTFREGFASLLEHP